MTTRELNALVSEITKNGTPAMQRLAVIQEIFDALIDRIDSLERRVENLKLQTTPFKNLASTGGKSVNRTPVS